MAKNDLILLDALLEQAVPNLPQLTDKGARFEFFVLDNLLKDYELSADEIEEGWVDGGNDGGIDGFYLFIDGLPFDEAPKAADVRRNPLIELVIITCKHEEAFRQVPINNLLASITDLFDLSKSREELIAPYNDELLDQRDLFCATYKELAGRQPTLRVSYIYASRGDTAQVAENVSARAYAVVAATKGLFSDCAVRFDFIGASEILSMARRQRTTTLRLTFIENFVSRAKSNYVVLVRLADYFQFVTDEKGLLRRYLFESNVRDYLGRNPVNEDIADSLNEATRIDQCDFWWLNNGVTIIATAANSAGKELSLENIQIVNGLQTTETIYTHFHAKGVADDERAILVKIIVTKDEEVRDRIIKATNYQTAVELASLRATEKIQRDIEDLLLKDNWFYDRRKNFHRNQGRPAHRIISPSLVASGIYSLVLKRPNLGAKVKTKFMRLGASYDLVFNPNWDIRVFPAVVSIFKGVESAMIASKLPLPGVEGRKVSDFRSLMSFVWVCHRTQKTDFQISDLLKLQHESPSNDELERIWKFLEKLRIEGSFSARRVYRNHLFSTKVIERLNNGGFAEI
jgi:AIPR protein